MQNESQRIQQEGREVEVGKKASGCQEERKKSPRRPSQEVACHECGKVVRKAYNRIARSKLNFCSQSCKHRNFDAAGKARTHAMTGTSIHTRWKGIRQRTMRPGATGYKDYGGRGIKMCQEWMDSFDAFYAYLGDPPSDKHTIDRIDNDKGYEPGNVRWATQREQRANARVLKNRHGLPGVQSTRGTYWSMITVGGVRTYLGSFKTAMEAHSAYLNARSERGIQTKTVSGRRD